MFQLKKNKTTIKTEVLAGTATFMTIAYILFVNPQILAQAGMDVSAVFVATCLICAFGSLLLGLLSNYPFAIAPGMGINAFFVFDLVQANGLSWQTGLGVGFLVGIVFLIISCTKLRAWIIDSMPAYFGQSIAAGLGLLIAYLGLSGGGLIQPGPSGHFMFADPLTPQTILFFFGFILIVVLDYYRIKCAVLGSSPKVAVNFHSSP
jgi:adenine/guanine/hypoxanthine permease